MAGARYLVGLRYEYYAHSWSLPPVVKPCRVVIPLSFVEMSSDNSELTFFLFLDEVFVLVEHLEQYNLLLSANFHMEPVQFLHTRHVEYLEQEQERQLVWLSHDA